MQNLLVQIPCKNEEADIGDVIGSVPRKIDGIRRVDILVIDDGSQDNTVERAVKAGADFIISKKAHFGLANSFSLGTSFFLSGDYDILVNTDGDNQYFQELIPDLIAPIKKNSAELSVGDRHVGSLKHFGFGKRLLQRLGSKVVTLVSTVTVPDAASGFRAYSRDLVARLNVTTKFSYAMETLIQAGNSDCRVTSVGCGARQVSRPSRLFKSSREHVWKSSLAILRGLISYRPLLVFLSLSLLLLVMGLLPFIRYVVLIGLGQSGDYLQSLITGVVFLLGSFSSASLGILSDSIRSNRIVYEKSLAIERLTHSKEQFEAALIYFRAELVETKRT